MHLNAFPHNPPPAVLAALAGLPRGKNQAVSALAARDRAILAALKDGHSADVVANAAGLSPRTVEKIVAGRPHHRGGDGQTRAPGPVRAIRPDAPSFGRVSFDQASPMALAVLAAKPGACRWPIEDGGGFQFCGAHAVASKSGGLTLRSFCAEHAGLAYRGQARVLTEAA